jgi:hypothetical protein
MVNAWGGANPTPFVDTGNDYELGVRYLVSADITVTAIRVYGTGGTNVQPNRKAYIRTTSDVILATVSLPDTLPLGWNTVTLNASIGISPGTTVWATYDANVDYAIIANAYPQNSSDNSITANSGGFNVTPGNLPNNLTATFYGVDFVFTVINHFPPTVTATATASGLTATVNLQIVDDHPETCTSLIEWGDGATANVNTLGPFVHTYAAPGLYAFLVTTTDADGNKDAFALGFNLRAPAVVGSEAAVRDGIGSYLVGPYSNTERAFLPALIGSPLIAGLNVARRAWQKNDDRRDFTLNAPAGTRSGALMIIQVSHGSERRIAVAGQGRGMKQVVHAVTLHCYIQSMEPYAEDAQDFGYTLKDLIFAAIRADVTCGTGGFEAGGFQIGEGGDPWLHWTMSTPATNAEMTRIYLSIEFEAHNYVTG